MAAVDIGATKTLVAVVPSPLEGWPDDVHVRRLPTDPEPGRLAEEVAAAIRELSDGARVVRVGIGTPGPLDAARGVIVHSPNQGWRDVPLAELVAGATGAPVLLDDDANVGALGEATLGAGQGRDPIVYLTLSTGVGGGIVIGGRILRGANGMAGEVGHLVVRADGPACSCGGRGHVEAYVGGACLADRGRAAWAAGRLAVGRPAPPDAAGVLALAAGDDAVAAGLVDEAVEALAVALATLVATIDPARVVVGGALGLAHPELVRQAAALARARTLSIGGSERLVVPAALGDSAVLAGAAVLASTHT